MTAQRIRALASNSGLQLGASVLILLFTWWILFIGVGFTTWSLAPYDSTLLEHHPPLGTWQRSMNDFFESPPGSYLPSTLVVGASVLLVVVALYRATGTSFECAKMILAFAASNILGSIALFLVFFADLPLNLTPPPGYGWTIKFLMPQFVLLVLLFLFQAWIIPMKFGSGSRNEPREASG